MSAGGGGAWKVAYADFVTAMMAFFLVMWITAQSNAVKQSIARYFQHPFDAASRSPVPSKSSSGASLVPLHRDMDGSIPHGNVHGKSPCGGGMLADDQPPADPKSVPKSGGLRRRTGVMLTENDPTGTGAFVQFDTRSAGLSDSAKRSLDGLLPSLQGKLNKVEVRGQIENSGMSSDMRAGTSGDATDPWQLSYQRCQAVMKYLEQNGVDPKRFRLSQSGDWESPSEADPDLPLRPARVQVYLLPEYIDDYLGHSSDSQPAPTAPAAGVE